MTANDPEEDIVEMFDNMYNKVTDTTSQLRDIEEKLIRASAEAEILKETNSKLHSECCILEGNVKSCQEKLDIICDLQNKIWKLEQELGNSNENLQTEVNQHKTIIESLQKDYAKETEATISHIKAEYTKEVAKITSCWKEAEDAKSSLEFQLRAAESEHKKGVAKIIIEYEARLLKASRQKADFLQHHHQVMHQDAIRKKMHHMKENYEREVASLKAQISDLQQRLESALVQTEDKNKNACQEKQKQSKLQLLPHHYIFQEKQSAKSNSIFEPVSRSGRKNSKP